MSELVDHPGNESRLRQTQRFVVMGVAGSGKSVVGGLFAAAMGLPFLEGDRLHPAENVSRMAAGIPLTDDDRRGWLLSIAQRLRDARARGEGLVVACSALKRGYRDVLRAGDPDVRFIHLGGTRALLAERLAQRTGHFMPATLLDSQLTTLELPDPDEGAWTVDIAEPVDEIVSRLVVRAASAGNRNTVGSDPRRA